MSATPEEYLMGGAVRWGGASDLASAVPGATALIAEDARGAQKTNTLPTIHNPLVRRGLKFPLRFSVLITYAS